MPELENLRHELFCQEYMTCFRIGEAAENAGFSSSESHRLIKNPAVVERIRELSRERFAFLEMESIEVLGRLAALARSDAVEAKDQLAALKLLAQHKKLIGTEVNVNITSDLAEKLERAAARRRTIDVTPAPEALTLDEGITEVVVQTLPDIEDLL